MFVRQTLRMVMLYHRPTSLGVTLHRADPRRFPSGGYAISLQCRGRFLQIVLGDWWGPYKERWR